MAQSEWVAREFRAAAERMGYLVQPTGVEDLFRGRRNWLHILTRDFSLGAQAIRTFPDMAVKTADATVLVEAKSAPGDPVRIELVQLILWRTLGGAVWYCLGYENAAGRLEGWMVRAGDLSWDVDHIVIPKRVRTWPDDVQQWLQEWLRWNTGHYKFVQDNVDVDGSGDPYACVPRRRLEAYYSSIEDWLANHRPRLRGGGYDRPI